MSTVEHQPRERSVPCVGCGRPTWAFDRRCEDCTGEPDSHGAWVALHEAQEAEEAK